MMGTVYAWCYSAGCNKTMKRIIYDLLSIGPLQFELYQQRQYQIDPRKPPQELIAELKNPKQAANMLRTLNIRGETGAKVLRRYTIVHWCLIYEPGLCEVFLEANFDGNSNDEWLSKNILKPYGAFLQKVCSSEEDYRRSKGKGVLDISFQQLFYIGTLLQELFLAAKKISPLARYYKESELQCQHLLRDFVMTLAFHAQELYTTFKAILGEIIRLPHRYVRSLEQREMVKYVLQDQLIIINENMKNLFLDKYFFPFGQGYGVKLLKIEELPDHSKDFVDDLLFNMPVKVRRPKKKTLDTLLFDEQGKLNPQVITTLAQIRLGDETMRNSIEESFRSQRLPTRVLEECIQDI